MAVSEKSIQMGGFGDIEGDLRKLAGFAGLEVVDAVTTGRLRKECTLRLRGEEAAFAHLGQLMATRYGPSRG